MSYPVCSTISAGGLNEAFVHHLTTGRPLVTLKLAQSLDSCVATRTGESQWITGPDARHRVHVWRAESDAILTGAGTAQIDNPSLTIRHTKGSQPQRLVIDSHGKLPANLKLFTDEWATHTTAIVSKTSQPKYAHMLQQRGGRLLRFPMDSHGHLDLYEVLNTLGAQTDRSLVQSLLIEAGPRLATAFLKANLVDRLYLFLAPKLIGQGLSTIGNLGVSSLSEAHTFAEHTWEVIESDLLFCGYKHRVQE